MALVTSNAQSELSALERGKHALHSGMDVKAYSDSIGRARGTVRDEVYAAEVAEAVSDIRHDTPHQLLVAIHPAAPRWLWPALVERLQAEGLPVARLREIVAELKGTPVFPSATAALLSLAAFWFPGGAPRGPSRGQRVSCYWTLPIVGL
jgi:hypothetical protein